MTGMLLFQLTRLQMISCLNVLNIQLNNFSENFNTSLISSQICLFVCFLHNYLNRYMVNNDTHFTTGRTTSHIKSLSTTLTNLKRYSDVNSGFVLRHAQEDTKRIVNKHSGSGKMYSEAQWHFFSKMSDFFKIVLYWVIVFFQLLHSHSFVGTITVAHAH